MSCLFRRSNGIWYMVYPDKDRRRWLSTGTTCFGEAWRLFRDLPAEHDRRNLRRISDFASEFSEHTAADYSPGTRRLRTASFRNLIACIGDKPIKFVTIMDVEQFKSTRARSVSAVTVNIDFRSLKAAFNVAVKWGVIKQNPFVQCKSLRIPEKEPGYLSKDEFNKALREAGDDQFRDLLVLAVSTMMRRGEIINLEWQDVDFDRRLIHVRNKRNFTVKGRRQRVIPMTERVHRTLAAVKKESGWVFSGRDGRQLDGPSVTRRFKRVMRRCGLPESIHFHSLRHTGASWLVQQDVPLYTVQKILGHTSLAVTQLYSHLSDENLRQAIEQINISPPFTSLN